MASEIMTHPCEITVGGWFNGKLTLKERNVQSRFCNRKPNCQAPSSRPPFLRLDSTGEAGDSSPEIEEELSVSHTNINDRPRQASGICQERQNTFTQGAYSKSIKKTSKRSSQYLQSNHSSTESKRTEFQEYLRSKFSDFSGKAAVSSYNYPEMSHFHQGQEMAHHIPMPANMAPGARGSLHQNPNIRSYPYVNMPVMTARSSVFQHPSVPRWNQPMYHSYMPRAPPPPPQLPLPPQLPSQPWIQCGYPFQGPPHLPLNHTRFTFGPQTPQFTQFSSQQQKLHNSFVSKPNHSSRRTFNNRHSGRERKHSKMFTKILQRPSQSHKEENSKDTSLCENLSELKMPQNNVKMAAANERESYAKDLGKDGDIRDRDMKSNFKRRTDVTTQCTTPSEGSKDVEILNKVEKESKKSKLVVEEENCVSRNRHSSIDFLLSGLNLKSSDSLSDSDFVDCDWDTLDDCNDLNYTWDEHFVSDDPYNPLTGWRCKKKSSVKSEEDKERSEWSCHSQEFDSGTESGSEDESDSDSVDWEGASDCSVSSRAADAVTCESEKAQSNKDNSVKEQDDQSGQTPTKLESEEESQNQENETAPTPADSAKRRKCLHPSISYILGENGSSSDDFSDDESDDWDSFDDSDDDFAPSLLRREDLNLFQFSNNHFNPLTSFLCNQAIRPELKRSPSVPCGPIFKPKARTVLISQRIICQVSDAPVSMMVPLEQSGKMSQNSIPTVQCSVVTSQQQSFPNSCLRQMEPKTDSKTPKKVHFNNKATLIICPEPSHLVDDIKSTRRGPWLDFARDRCRFQHRIQHLEKTIGPCLSAEHRKKIAESRQLSDTCSSGQVMPSDSQQS